MLLPGTGSTRKPESFYERFEHEFGAVLCASLTECDLGTPEGQKKFKERGLHKNLCSKFVQGVTRWAGEMIEEKPGI